ncbi:MAG: hypothetical protein ACR2H1_09915 [Limisphaerales bacterium]
MKNIKFHLRVGALLLLSSAATFPFANSASAVNACDRQPIAARIRDNGRISLATTHSSGVSDSANARQTIVDTANGGQAWRSAYGTAPGGTVWLDPRMLDCMERLANVFGYTYSVSETSGGSHSSGSYHYSGTAVDIYIINGVGVSSSNPYWQTFNQRCRDMGSIESLGPGYPGHDTHVHNAWGTGAGINVAPSGCVPPFRQRIYGQPVGNHSGGALEVFATATASGNAIYSSVQSGVNGPFQAWNNGVGQNWGSPKPVVVGTQPDGRMQLFIIGQDTAVYTKWQNVPGGPWSNWALVGGSVLQLKVAQNADGRLQLMMIGTDQQIWTTAQTGPNANGSFGGWYTFGENAMNLPLTMGNSVDGRLQFFFIGTDSQVYSWYQTTPNGNNGTSSWARLAFGGGALSVDVGNNADGRLQLFVVGTDRQIWTVVQLSPLGGWGGWSTFGENVQPGICYAPRADGGEQIFFVGTDSQVYTLWEPGANNGNWQRLGLGGIVKPGLTAGLNPDGRITLFGIDLNGGAWGNSQNSANNSWYGWAYIGTGGGGFTGFK